MKIAVLSNTNTDYMVRILRGKAEVFQPEGYGNVSGAMLNPASSYNLYAPQITFLLMDLMELINHEIAPHVAKEKITEWFSELQGGIHENRIYYISDAFLTGEEAEIRVNPLWKSRMEMLWNEKLMEFSEMHGNVRVFCYAELVSRIGAEKAFSRKQWYMGKMLLSMQAQKLMAEEILHRLEVEKRTPRKVLLLDLDGTLWGGVAGEEKDIAPIELSDDHVGLIYKNVQRMIKRMQEQGVLLAIVSKNNESDVLPILKKHPHMILRENDFVSVKINWEQKHINIMEIAKELNVGLNSFVFWDDNPTERELVRQMLPEVAVPDFPDNPEELPEAVLSMYQAYFERAYLTEEDLAKTEQYQGQAKRAQMQKEAVSFSDYLKRLQIKIIRVDDKKHFERLHQLINKTNQFNLTTRRYTQQELSDKMADEDIRIYAYRVSDCFGDYGITAVVIVDLRGNLRENAKGDFVKNLNENLRAVPVVEEFAMSCRIMGKQMENAIMEDVEKSLRRDGYEALKGFYIPTSKNKPVENFYASLGYQEVEKDTSGKVCYKMDLENAPMRTYEALVADQEEER